MVPSQVLPLRRQPFSDGSFTCPICETPSLYRSFGDRETIFVCFRCSISFEPKSWGLSPPRHSLEPDPDVILDEIEEKGFFVPDRSRRGEDWTRGRFVGFLSVEAVSGFMPEQRYEYRVKYRIGGDGPQSFEVIRRVHSPTLYSLPDVMRKLNSRWEGQPIRSIEVLEPSEQL